MGNIHEYATSPKKKNFAGILVIIKDPMQVILFVSLSFVYFMIYSAKEIRSNTSLTNLSMIAHILNESESQSLLLQPTFLFTVPIVGELVGNSVVSFFFILLFTFIAIYIHPKYRSCSHWMLMFVSLLECMVLSRMQRMTDMSADMKWT